MSDWILSVLLFGLIVNSVFANWTNSLYWDLFFARVQGPIFYNAHASSILIFCASIGLRIVLERFKDIARWILVGFAIGGLHEFSIVFANLTIGNCGCISGMSLNYSVWLTIFVVAGIKFGNPLQRKTIALGAIIVYAFSALIILSGQTVYGFAPTSFFLNPQSNIVEVLSWISAGASVLVPLGMLLTRLQESIMYYRLNHPNS